MGVITCVHCGLQQSDRATVCGICGKPLRGSVTPAPMTAAVHHPPRQQQNQPIIIYAPQAQPVQICPLCHQPAVFETTTGGLNVGLFIIGISSVLACFPIFFFIGCFSIFFLVIGLICMSMANVKSSSYRQCHACGHKWLVG